MDSGLKLVSDRQEYSRDSQDTSQVQKESHHKHNNNKKHLQGPQGPIYYNNKKISLIRMHHNHRMTHLHKNPPETHNKHLESIINTYCPHHMKIDHKKIHNKK